MESWLIDMTTIKEARQAAGLTQKEMAERFKIPRRTIEDWERGVRQPPEWAELLITEKLQRMAQAALPTTAEK